MTDSTSQTVSIDAALQLAVSHHQAGRLHEAEQIYRAILEAQPDHATANHNLGVLAGQTGHYAEGLPFLEAALGASPDRGEYFLSYANALLAVGRAGEALGILQSTIQRGFDTPDAQALLQKAEAALQGEQPIMFTTDFNRLIALYEARQYVELENQASLLLERQPDAGFIWKALGLSLQAQGKNAQAAFQRAVELSPEDADAHVYLGVALQTLGQFDRAAQCYLRALEIKPDFAEAHSNLGIALKNSGQIHNAVASFQKALEIKPNFAEAHYNLGNALRDIGQFNSAMASYTQALEAKPDYLDALSNLLIIYNFMADRTPAMLLTEARRYGELVARQARPYSDWRNTPEPARRLRVGLVSGDLRMHPVGHFVEGVMAALKDTASERLEFHAYPNQTRSDAVTERIKACCQGWHSAVGLSDESLAQRIYDDGIDILIDLSGHTADNRLSMFAWKPAPIQVSWQGWFATTGVAAMDYFIADPWTVPETEATHFTEKIQRLPETYQCFTPPDIDVPVAPLPALTNGTITFGCFNNLTKMNDAVVALWARVLLAMPGSRLFLKARQLGEAAVRQSVIHRFATHGIAAERLIMEDAPLRAELLAACNRVDIALDPFPYPGGTTSIETLWMGVPVLTLAGDRFLSHNGESILQNAGLPEWIAKDADDYVARAVSHAGDLPRLVTLRKGLRQQVLASPIFDAPRFAGHFETALREMWREWCNSRVA